MYGKIPINKGKPMPEETREKCRINAHRSSCRLGKKHTAEARQLMSDRTRGKNVGITSPSFKGFVIAHTLEGIYAGRFEGIQAAARGLGVDFRKVSKVILGYQAQTGGYIFKREIA